METNMGDHGSKLLSILTICLFVLTLNTQVVRSDLGRLTYLHSAVTSKGAACLSGSPPAYSLSPGSGSGANSWLIFLEGGAWCNSKSGCEDRAKTWNGDSSRNGGRTDYNGIFTANQTFNPDFYNWNRVYVVYCDGSSFSSDIEEVDPETKIFYRGARVFDAIMEDLLARGMNNADNVILSGGSAGGLATMLHCDSFRQQIVPHAKRVKCVADSGFFMHAKNLPGAKEREDYFTSVVELHQMAKNIPSSCTSKMNPGLCLFPENLVNDIQTPLFIVETSFDFHQLNEMVTRYIGGGRPEWHDCLNKNLALCNSTQIEIMQEFQKTFINTLQNLKNSSTRGMFVDTCYIHEHIKFKESSTCSSMQNSVLENRSIAGAIGDWFYDRTSFQHIDTNNVPRNCTKPLDVVNSYEYNKQCFKFIEEHKHQ